MKGVLEKIYLFCFLALEFCGMGKTNVLNVGGLSDLIQLTESGWLITLVTRWCFETPNIQVTILFIYIYNIQFNCHCPMTYIHC